MVVVVVVVVVVLDVVLGSGVASLPELNGSKSDSDSEGQPSSGFDLENESENGSEFSDSENGSESSDSLLSSSDQEGIDHSKSGSSDS